MTERMDREGVSLPYRWGYFQGTVLLPGSLLIIVGSIWDLWRVHSDPSYIAALAFVTGLVGIPLGVGLLLKRRFALVMLYVMFGLALLLVAIKIPVAVRHAGNPGALGAQCLRLKSC